MPQKPRSEVFDPENVGIYHCWNRLVRRGYLFGYDPLSGNNYDHRKDWFREQLRELAAVMALDILDYGILDNHFHLVVRNRPDIVSSWSDEEIARRWWYVCPARRDEDGSAAEPKPCEIRLLLADVQEYRKRLSDISWIIRLACQRVARRANREDDVDGRFFAKRFDSDRLETEADVLACSLYVDLNWIHAGMADTPEQSHYTSAADRIRARWRAMASDLGDESGEKMSEFPSDDDWLAPIFLDERAEAYVGPHTLVESLARSPTESLSAEGDAITGASDDQAIEPAAASLSSSSSSLGAPPAARLPFSNPIGAARVSNKGFLPITLDAYLQLLDEAGRLVRSDKRGAIPKDLPPILERLNLEPKRWIESFLDFFGGRSAFRPCPLILKPG